MHTSRERFVHLVFVYYLSFNQHTFSPTFSSSNLDIAKFEKLSSFLESNHDHHSVLHLNSLSIRLCQGR